MNSSTLAPIFLAPLILTAALFAIPKTLPDGLHYDHQTNPPAGFATPLSIHILKVNPSRIKILPVHAGSNILALEPVSSMAKRLHAFAAINGGFFRAQGRYKGTSAGILRIDGEWYSSPRFNRGAIGWKQTETLQHNQVAIDRIALVTRLHIDGIRALPADGINQPPTMTSAILYTSRFSSSTLTSASFAEMVIDANGTCHEQTGPSMIPHKGYVYSLAPLASHSMPFLDSTPQGHVQFDAHSLNHPDDSAAWSSFPHIVGGTPVLISNGEIIQNFAIENLPDSFLKERRPRTAVGIDSHGNWIIVVVDGDDQKYSIGMTIPELASFMHGLSCIQALNLGGGNSSTLVIDSEIINLPSSILTNNAEHMLNIETPVSDAILFFPIGGSP